MTDDTDVGSVHNVFIPSYEGVGVRNEIVELTSKKHSELDGVGVINWIVDETSKTHIVLDGVGDK